MPKKVGKTGSMMNIGELEGAGSSEPFVQVRITFPVSLYKRIIKMKKGHSLPHEHDIIRFATSDAVAKAGY